MVFRQAILDDDYSIVAINARYPAETLAHLIKYDSIHGRFTGEVEAGENELIVNGKTIKLVNERNPEDLPWKEHGVDIVIEATGKFNAREKAAIAFKSRGQKSHFNSTRKK